MNRMAECFRQRSISTRKGRRVALSPSREKPMKLRAIIFEEVESLRDLLSIALQDRNYEVYSFPDPSVCPLYKDFDARCPQDFPCADLLITDNRFLKMTGVEFIRLHVERGCKAPVENTAVMSDRWTASDLDLARRLGCKIFQKPFRFKDFSDWLDSREKSFDPSRKLGVLPPPSPT